MGIGGKGANPQLANIYNPTDAGQIWNSYVGNQSALGQQQNLLNALQGQNGIQNQSNVFNQLQGVAAGTGPNPAKTMLAQSTGQNVAQQAALAAGQRGAAGNVGLMARQAAQTGAGAQQQAAGQAATMQAQQSLGALGQMGALANQQVGQQIGATGAVTGAQQAEQQNILGAQQAYNQSQVANQASVNAGNASQAGAQAPGQAGLVGGITSGIGSIFGLAGGGDVPPTGAMAGVAAGDVGTQQQNGPRSGLGRFLQGLPSPDQGGTYQAGNVLGQGIASMFKAEGGQAHDYRGGGKVNAASVAEKAAKSGNSYSNDKIPAVLSEHEIVLPRSVTMSKDPVRASADFVAKTIAKRKTGKK